MKKIILSNGVEMPAIGLGTFPLRGRQLNNAVRYAYKAGYRLFDTADNYYNEADLGDSLSSLINKGNRRDDIFLVTKLTDSYDFIGKAKVSTAFNRGIYFWKNSPYMQSEDALQTIIHQKLENSLRCLRTDYLDLWLMHWPYPDYFCEIWHVMEEIYVSGKVKAIGVCNCRERNLEMLKSNCSIFPMVNQVECSPLNTKQSLVNYCISHGIQLMTYSPLMAVKKNEIKNNSFINELCKKYKKSLHQVILRWNIQRKFVPIPKSSHKERIEENISVFDFVLTDSEMIELCSMNINYQTLPESKMCPGF
jgi:diketogulonate reductase-like aldo/keto reductase